MRWLLIACLMFSGCTPLFTRTIYVPDGKMVRVRKTVKNWPIWVKQTDGTWIEGRMDIHEGWFAAPLKEEK